MLAVSGAHSTTLIIVIGCFLPKCTLGVIVNSLIHSLVPFWLCSRTKFMALWMAVSDCQSVPHFGPDWNTSITTGWIVITLQVFMEPRGGNPNEFGDPLTFPQRHLEANICGFLWIVWTSIRWLVMTFCTHIHAFLRMNCNHFCNLLTFHLVPSSGKNISFVQYFR